MLITLSMKNTCSTKRSSGLPRCSLRLSGLGSSCFHIHCWHGLPHQAVQGRLCFSGADSCCVQCQCRTGLSARAASCEAVVPQQESGSPWRPCTACAKG